MWTKTKSLFLSRVLTLAMSIMLVVYLFIVPVIAEWYTVVSEGTGFFEGSIYVPMCIMLYICGAFAIIAAAALHVLLYNIDKERVFIPQNTKCLRIISWACMLVGVTFFVFGLWRNILWFASFFALFLGLVMRVLKNVFEKAVELKSENDFTI